MNQQNNNSKYNMIFWLIPVLVLGYIGWMNVMPLGSTLTYFIDVGGNDTGGQARITGPFDRISEGIETRGVTFRELQKSLVYFKLDDRSLTSAREVSVNVRFRDTFPENAVLTTGAGNTEKGTYLWKNSYAPSLKKLESFPLLAKDDSVAIYSTEQNTGADIQSVHEFLRNPPSGSVIATNDKGLSFNQEISEVQLAGIDPDQLAIEDVWSKNVDIGEGGSLRIKNSLRGDHTLWTFVANGLLVLEITKQDLNWYEGPDKLAIEFYSSEGKISGKIEIPDDGDEGKSNQLGQLQRDTLYLSGLDPGAYRIELKSGSDLLINEIAINQSKLVIANRVFPVGMNSAYFKDRPAFDSLKLYSQNSNAVEVKFRTLHKSGFQPITVRGDNSETELDINAVNSDFRMSLKPGSYQFDVPGQNVIVETRGYFSFTPESFFLPRRCEVIDLQYDMTWLKEKAAYVVVNYREYSPPVNDGNGWLVSQNRWQTKDLFINNNSLSFCLNAPHLEAQPENVIPVDWIEINLKVPPVWERIRWNK